MQTPSTKLDRDSLWVRFRKRPKTAGERRASTKKRAAARQRTVARQELADAIVAAEERGDPVDPTQLASCDGDGATPSTVDRGAIAEARAVAYLARRGYTIHDRNYRVNGGELDIVASDGAVLVFVEVRSRGHAFYGHPVESVSWGKRKQVTRVAQIYVMRERPLAREMRFDVITLTGGTTLEHWVDAWRVGD
ncbi:MAG TPA: YraN family protein [Kofleriaceae bacterium]